MTRQLRGAYITLMTIERTTPATTAASSFPEFLTDLRDDSPFVDPADLRTRMRPEIKFLISIGAVALCSLAIVLIVVIFDPGQLTGPGTSTAHLLWAAVGFFILAGLIATLFAMAAMGVTPVLIAFRYVGYLLASLIAGDRLACWYAGPFRIFLRPEGIATTLHGSKSLAKLGGMGVASSKPYSRAWEVFRAIGPFIGSFLLLCIAGPVALGSFLIWRSDSFIGFIGLYSGVWSGTLAVMAAMTCLADLPTLMRAFTDERHGRLSFLVRAVTSTVAQGQRRRDIDPGRIQEMESLSRTEDLALPTRIEATRELFAYHIEMDERNKAKNELAYLLALLDKAPKQIRRYMNRGTLLSIYDLAAYYYGFYERDPLNAIAWLSRANEDSVTPRPVRLRSEAAALLASGHYDEARTRATRARELSGRFAMLEMRANGIQAIIDAVSQVQPTQPVAEQR